MPYAIKPNMQDDKNKDQNGVNISGGGGADFSTGIPGQESTSAPKSPASSGTYANINSYIDANRTQGDEMGQKIASGVESKALDAQNKITNFESNTAPQVKAYDPNEAYSKLGSLSDQEKQDYRNFKNNGGYTGPDSVDKVQGYGDAQKATTEASGMVKNSGNEYGQQALLKDAYKRPDYSAGQNRLDQVLLQNSAGSKQALEGLSQKYSGLDQMFNNASTNVGNAVNTANQTALQNKNNIAQGETQQWNSLINPIQQRADDYNSTRGEVSGRIENDIRDNVLNEETIKALGLTPEQRIYGTNIGNYFQKDLTPAGLNDIANADERSKYQQLEDLFQDPTRTQITADGKAIKPYGFDLENFNKDVAAKDAELADLFKNTSFEGTSQRNARGHNASHGFENNTIKTNATVADYLARGTNAFNTAGFYGDGGQQFNPYEDDENADYIGESRNSLLDQINRFLDQNYYNRRIEKG